MRDNEEISEPNIEKSEVLIIESQHLNVSFKAETSQSTKRNPHLSQRIKKKRKSKISKKSKRRKSKKYTGNCPIWH
jgi:hypothetical protein